MEECIYGASWRQIKIRCKPENVDELESVLFDAGVHSLTLENDTNQCILEPELGTTPLWEKLTIVGLFDLDIHEKSVEQALRQRSPNLIISWNMLIERNWSDEYKKYFIPIRCGERLSICPSWVKPAQNTMTNLILDPGIAFGTGGHPSTYLCLNWLDHQTLNDQSVLDFGCGSGILGIAALLLGANSVIAVDHDPQALIATRDNAKRNKIDSKKLLCFLPENLPPNRQFDFVLANILAQTLIDIESLLTDLTSPGGLICLSGILKEQADEVRNRYISNFEIIALNELDGWISLCGQKRQPSSAKIIN